MARGAKHVAVVNGRSNYQFRVGDGVADYARQNARWHLHVTSVGPELIGLDFEQLEDLRRFRGDGVVFLGSVNDGQRDKDAKILDGLKARVVYATPVFTPYRLPCVIPDEEAAGRLMAGHLMGLGLANFAYFGYKEGEYGAMNHREAGFVNAIAAAGRSCAVHHEDQLYLDLLNRRRACEIALAWLKSLPKPVGIGACYDGHAACLVQLCRMGRIRIPSDVAIISTNNDLPVCFCVRPSISSVDQNLWQCGYRAAELLDALMRGRRAPSKPIRVGPMGWIQRDSSAFVPSDDDVVERCIRYIHNHVEDGVAVADLLEEVQVSRRSLELRFKRAKGCTPAVEIRQSQIERAKQLLAETSLPMTSVAYASGFNDQRRFSEAFRRAMGRTPTMFRRR